jgi:ABC-type multidrug transport system fused ATPase/permease subunit
MRPAATISALADVMRASRRVLALVLKASLPLSLALAALSILQALIPLAMAVIAARLIDSVAAAANTGFDEAARASVTFYVALEAGLILAGSLVGLLAGQAQKILQIKLAEHVNTMILEKAVTLDLLQFENAEFYDKLNRAKEEAGGRPLSMVMEIINLGTGFITVCGAALLLSAYSIWAVAVIVIAAIPSFVMEITFSREQYGMRLRRTPDQRQQHYLNAVLTLDSHAKEVRTFALGPMLISRFREISQRIIDEQRRIGVRQDAGRFLLGGLGTVILYLAYGSAALSAATGRISIGDMTLYLQMFRQGQGSVSGFLRSLNAIFRDRLFLSSLYEFLDAQPLHPDGTEEAGLCPGDGIRFEEVTFSYPGAPRPVLEKASFHIAPGETLALVGRNGAGKTTLVKLLARLYRPDSGQILLDGLDLNTWRGEALQRRMTAIFQDFTRYHFLAGENIGVGNVAKFGDEEGWRRAAEMGMARDMIEDLPEGYRTQLGKWFTKGSDLSGGQWQKIALSRAHMHEGADIVILDEPTASVDVDTEMRLMRAFGDMLADKIGILISHRFSTVRLATKIIVLEGGKIVEAGDHASLMRQGGEYARMFRDQAAAYC